MGEFLTGMFFPLSGKADAVEKEDGHGAVGETGVSSDGKVAFWE